MQNQWQCKSTYQMLNILHNLFVVLELEQFVFVFVFVFFEQLDLEPDQEDHYSDHLDSEYLKQQQTQWAFYQSSVSGVA